jgi:transposase
VTVTAGFDIAKEFHWLCVLDHQGRVVVSHRVENEPDAIEQAVAELAAIGRTHGELTVGLDLLGGIAALLTAMLLAAGLRCVHTPGLAVNRARAGTRGGMNKSDPRDAAVIAELVARRSDLRTVTLPAESTAELRLLVAHRGHLVKDQVAQIARLRELVAGIHPGLERVTAASLILLTGYVTAAEIRAAGPGPIAAHLRAHGVKRPTALSLAHKAVTAASAQHTVIVGERRTAALIRELAGDLLARRERIKALEAEIAKLVDAHPDAALIASLPGMGATLTAEFLALVGDIERFDDADALAAAAGLAPRLTASGKVRYTRSATGGDKALKRVFYQSAFCALSRDTDCRAFYDRKRDEGKRHHQALIALARRRVNVLYAMLRDRQPYQARTPARLPA